MEKTIKEIEKKFHEEILHWQEVAEHDRQFGKLTPNMEEWYDNEIRAAHIHFREQRFKIEESRKAKA